MFFECLKSVLRACRSEAACSRRKWRDACLIETYQQDEGKNEYFSNEIHAFCELFSFSIMASIWA